MPCGPRSPSDQRPGLDQVDELLLAVHADDECSEVVDVDVLVVGAGCSGLPAAVTTAEEGAKVMLVDRMEQGFGIRCSALGAIDSSIQQELGVTIDKMDILNDIARYADGQCDMRIWKMWADESGDAVSWYIDHCNQSGAVYVENEYNMPEGTRYRCWPTGHASLGVEMKWAAEHAMLDYFINYLEGFDGCEHRGTTKLDELIVGDGKVVGAYLATGEDFDDVIRVNAAKGVVVATGGYVLNGDMMQALQPETFKSLASFFTQSQVYGEGIKACMNAGAKFEETHTALVFDRGAVHADVELGNPFSGNAGQNSQLLREGGDHLMGNEPEAVVGSAEAAVEEGTCIKADTIEELAEGLGLPAETLVATVERYNELVDAGYDEDFGKDAFRLSAIKEPPFYGLKLGGTCLCTFDGIEITPDCEARGVNGEVIEGLYVIGNDAGNKYNKTYPNFAAGLNAGLCVTMGRHVGKLLAAK